MLAPARYLADFARFVARKGPQVTAVSREFEVAALPLLG
jgi:hypothetical protein